MQFGSACLGPCCFEFNVPPGHGPLCPLRAQLSCYVSSSDSFISASLPEVIGPSFSKNKIHKNECKCPHRNCVAGLGMSNLKMIQNMPVNLSDYN